MKKMKILKERGITLIALVITIIILLILAGVSIAMLTGENGILSQAQKASEENERAAEEEAIRLAVTSLNAEKYTNPSKFPDGMFTSEQLDEETSKYKEPDQVTGYGTLTVTYNQGKDDERNYVVTQDGEFLDKDIIEETPENAEVLTGKDGTWNYIMLNSNEIQLTKYLGSNTDLVVPANYDGYKVTAVGNVEVAQGYINKNILGDNATLNSSTGNTKIESIVIEEGIKSIKDDAFMSFKGVTSLTIPNSVVYIGALSFCDMQNLEGELKLPNSLYYIGYQAFTYDKKLTGDLIIPESVAEIGIGAFGYTGFNGNLKISKNMREIPDCAFYGIKFTGKLNIPENIAEIGETAFAEATFGGGDLIIPEGVEKIGGGAFSNITGFNGNLVLPSTLKEIGARAFHSTGSLTGTLELPENLEKLGGYAFAHCSGFDNTSITIPKSIKEIGDGDFNIAGFRELPSKLSPAGTTMIPIGYNSHTFYNCATNTLQEFIVEDENEVCKAVDGVLYNKDGTEFISYPSSKQGTEYEMEEGVTFINELSFSRARYLEKLTLPDSLEIKEYESQLNSNKGNNLSVAIYGYTSINEIAVKDSNPRYKTIAGCLYSKDGSTLWYIPTDKEGTVNIAEGTTTIKGGAFTYGDNNSLYSVYIPASVKEISEQSIESLNTMVSRGKVTIDSGCAYTISNGKVVKK